MDLIVGVKRIENSPGGRQSGHGREEHAHKNKRIEAADGNGHQAEATHSPAEYDSRLGRKLDTTA